MKVLFAVGSAVTSEKIASQYTSTYGEKLEYKDVFYFKAILEEVKRNKSYDRIVIAESLEPMQNNVIDEIDRMLFNNIDSITDEIEDSTIIFICNDNRSKDDPFIGRLFNLGIYNVLMGDERQFADLCRLIKNPRNKKEAKDYLKSNPAISGDSSVRQDEGVNENELVNICNYFDNLRTSEEYVSAFANVKEQYSDDDLIVIVAALTKQLKRGKDIFSALNNDPRYSKYCEWNQALKNQTSGNKKEKRGLFGWGKNKKSGENESASLKQAVEDRRNNNVNPIKDYNADIGETISAAAGVITGGLAGVSNNQLNEEKFKAQQEQYMKAQQEELMRQQQEAQMRAQQEELMRQQQEAQMRAQQDELLRQQQEAQMRAQQDELLRQQQEAQRLQQEELMRQQQEAQMRAQQDELLRQQQEAQRLQQEELMRQQQEAQMKAQQEELMRQQQEAQMRAQQDELLRQQQEAQKLQQEELMRQQQEAQMRAQQDELLRQQQEAQRLQQEELMRQQQEAQMKAQQDELLRQQQEAQMKAQQEELMRQQQEAQKLQQEELIRQQQEAKMRAQQEEFQRQRELLQQQYNNVYDTQLNDNYNSKYSDPYNNSSDRLNYNSFDSSSTKDLGLNTVDTEEYDANIGQVMQVPADYKKIVAFVGTSKVGTSFLVNCVATLMASKGVKTSILDMTKNRGEFFYFEDYMKENFDDVSNCMSNLSVGVANPVSVGRRKNLNLYTTVPKGKEDNRKGYRHRNVIDTVKKNCNLLIIDCDFTTPMEYFEQAQDIYIVQDLDLLKVNETKDFLKELKDKNIDWSKLRVVFNNVFRSKLTPKKIINNAFSYYTDISETYTDEFEKIKRYIEIPMDPTNYAVYIEATGKGKIDYEKFTPQFKQCIETLSTMVYGVTDNHQKKKGIFG